MGSEWGWSSGRLCYMLRNAGARNMNPFAGVPFFTSVLTFFVQIYSFWVWVLRCTLFRPKRNVTSILWGSGWRCRILGMPRRSLTSWPLSAVLPRSRPR